MSLQKREQLLVIREQVQGETQLEMWYKEQRIKFLQICKICYQQLII